MVEMYCVHLVHITHTSSAYINPNIRRKASAHPRRSLMTMLSSWTIELQAGLNFTKDSTSHDTVGRATATSERSGSSICSAGGT